jgi:hypothetical protein
MSQGTRTFMSATGDFISPTDYSLRVHGEVVPANGTYGVVIYVGPLRYAKRVTVADP